MGIYVAPAYFIRNIGGSAMPNLSLSTSRLPPRGAKRSILAHLQPVVRPRLGGADLGGRAKLTGAGGENSSLAGRRYQPYGAAARPRTIRLKATAEFEILSLCGPLPGGYSISTVACRAT